jgi:hypothetical protein
VLAAVDVGEPNWEGVIVASTDLLGVPVGGMELLGVIVEPTERNAVLVGGTDWLGVPVAVRDIVGQLDGVPVGKTDPVAVIVEDTETLGVGVGSSEAGRSLSMRSPPPARRSMRLSPLVPCDSVTTSNSNNALATPWCFMGFAAAPKI